MTFVKIQKNKAYFKRFQTKYKRRRLGKTDYYARKRLVKQAKNKYNTPKYRFVVRFTNRYVICQVVYSLKDFDNVLCAAYSSELPRYGLKVGLKNYTAAYATGLLCARRLLSKMSVNVEGADGSKRVALGELYAGTGEVTGEVETCVDEDNGRKYFVGELARDEDEEVMAAPFRAFLDVGIQRTSKGCRIFGALKGAVDGGLDIPHNEKLFPGYTEEDGEVSYDAEFHKDKIMGVHLAEYMEELKEDDEDSYNSRFSSYIAAGVDHENLVDTVEATLKAIREDPSPKHNESNKAREYDESGNKKPNAARAASLKAHPQQRGARKLSRDERRARVEAKKQEMRDYLLAQAEDDE